MPCNFPRCMAEDEREVSTTDSELSPVKPDSKRPRVSKPTLPKKGKKCQQLNPKLIALAKRSEDILSKIHVQVS